MTRDQLRTLARDCLLEVAPDLADEPIPEDADLRGTLDLDSMDILNWITALHQKTGIAIPESDYARLFSLNAAVDYLSSGCSA